MDKYKILSLLNEGSQGDAYLVEEKGKKENFVMKKIEFKDEIIANQAYSEIKILKNLQHEYVCKFLDFFIFWDNDISAINLCIIMQHYENCDLKTKLSKLRQSDQSIDMKKLEMWVGQLLHALSYIHMKCIVHRDLKPGNVLFSKNDDLCIGDFGFSIDVDQQFNKSRCSIGQTIYMAPETHSETNVINPALDIWSFGCILMELTTYHFFDLNSFAKIMIKCKHIKNDLDFETALNQICSIYSDDIIKIIKGCIEIDVNNRLTIEKLKNFKFIKQCLKTSEQRLNYLNIKRCKKESTIDMPLENISQIDNFEVAINEINKNYYDCESNKLLIEKIELLVKTENLSNIKNLHLNFTNMLINFVENSDIHLKSWTLLKNYFESIDINEMYLPNEFLNVLLESSKVHIANDMILCEILKIIKRISSKEKVSIFLVKHEFLNIIKLIMEIKIQSCNNDETSLNVVKLSLCSFWSTTIFDSTRIHFIKDNYITPIVELLKKYTDHEEIISEIYPAIMSLALEPSSYPLIVDMNIIDYILQGILKFKRSSDLIKNAICAINILCSNSEMCAYQLLLNNDDETEHLSTIIELCLENIDSITMVESYMNLFLDLLFYEEVMHNMKLFNIEKLIFKVCEMYKNSDDIMIPTKEIMKILDIKME